MNKQSIKLIQLFIQLLILTKFQINQIQSQQMQDYQRLYEQSKITINKLEQKVASLQQQIRERCQSYLLQISKLRRKPQNTNSKNQIIKVYQSQIRPNPSLYSSQIQLSNQASQIGNSCISLKNDKSNINQQTQTTKPHLQIESHVHDQVIKSLKNRIAAMQMSKNESVKQLEHLKDKYKEKQSQINKLKSTLKQHQKSNKKKENAIENIGKFQQAFKMIEYQLQQIELLKSDYIPQSYDQIERITSLLDRYKKRVQYGPSFDDNIMEYSEARTYKQDEQSQFKLKTSPFQISNQKAKNIEQLKQQITLYQQQIKTLKKQLQFKQILQKQCYKLSQELATFKINNNKNIKFNEEFIEKLNQQKNISKQLSQKYIHLQSQFTTLKQQNKNLEEKNKKIQANLVLLKRQNLALREQIQKIGNHQSSHELTCQSKDHINRINEELQIQISRLKNQLKNTQIKDISNNYKNNDDLAPYIIQQDLDRDSTNEFVKRKFIRKKVIRRNLSAMAFKSVSKDKRQTIQTLQNKLKTLRQSSGDPGDQQRMKKFANKIEKLQKKLQNPRVSQASKQSSSDNIRQSKNSQFSQGSNDDIFEIVQLRTDTPLKTIYAGKIFETKHVANIQRTNRFNFAKKGKTESLGSIV